MSIFPFADWFYHLSEKEKSLTSKYNEYTALCESLQATGAKFDHDLETLQKMAVMNYGLLIVAAQCKMSESEYVKFLNENSQLPPANPGSATVIEVLQGTSSLLGLASFAGFLWNLKEALTPAFRSAAEDAASDLPAPEADGLLEITESSGISSVEDLGITEEGDAAIDSIASATSESGAEAGSEAGIEATSEAVASASSAGLAAAASGLGIVLAVGIDAILGAIDGAKQSEELKSAMDKLVKALKVIKEFSTKLDSEFTTLKSKVVAQEKTFIAGMNVLNGVEPATFSFGHVETTYENRVAYVVQMGEALAQYGYLTKIRDDWTQFKANKQSKGQTAEWSEFAQYEIAFKPRAMTKKTAEAFLNFTKTKLVNP